MYRNKSTLHRLKLRTRFHRAQGNASLMQVSGSGTVQQAICLLRQKFLQGLICQGGGTRLRYRLKLGLNQMHKKWNLQVSNKLRKKNVQLSEYVKAQCRLIKVRFSLMMSCHSPNVRMILKI